MSAPATNARPIVFRTNTIFATLGMFSLLLVVLSFVVDALKASKGASPADFWLRTVVLLPLGLALLSRRDWTVVDPGAGTVVRQVGFWPFVRSTRRALADVTEIVKDTVRIGRTRGPRVCARLRLHFTDGEAWEVYLERSPGKTIDAQAERLATLTGRPLVMPST